ncbi:MAG: hypothetical protein IKB56_07140, partial [Clostridia bacterium]|nr:hypothetical protein [Clostridia bacterium]
QVANNTISTSEFEIVGWNYVDADGFKPSYSFVGEDVPQINVMIANVGWKEGKKIWSQQVTLTLTEKLLPAKEIKEINTVYEDSYSITGTQDDYVLTIEDPFKFELPSAVRVTFMDGTVGMVDVSFDFGDNKFDFYSQSEIEGIVVLGDKVNNQVTFDMTYENKNPRDVDDITYYVDAEATQVFDKFEYDALEVFELPKYAKITVDDTLEDNVYDVTWKSIQAYGLEGGLVLAEAWIGDDVFGYIKAQAVFTINAESIYNYNLPNSIRLNPYAVDGLEKELDKLLGLTDGCLNVTTTLGNEKSLDVQYPHVPLDYRVTTTHDVDLSVGVTLDFGGVESIVDNDGNIIAEGDNCVLEVRQNLPIMIVVESRVAVGVSTWYTNETTNITGNVYEPIDFSALGRATIVAIGQGKSNNSKLIGSANSLAELLETSGAVELDSTLWPSELYGWNSATELAKANGQIAKVYHNATTDTYFIAYRGNVDVNALLQRFEESDLYEKVSDNGYKVSGDDVLVEVKSFEEGVTVLFANGEEEKYDLVFDDSSVIYSFPGGTFNVKATLGSGETEQIFYFKVYLHSSYITQVGVTTAGVSKDSVVRTNEDGVITELIVDPYVGFVGLPEKVMAYFDNMSSPVELDVDWDYAKILSEMTSAGGRYDASNNKAVIAKIFVTKDDGSLIVQNVEIPVTVLNRTRKAVFVSKYASNEDYVNAKNAGTATGEEFEQLLTTLTLNPYVEKYSEDFNSNDFYYYRRVLIIVNSVEGEDTSSNMYDKTGKELIFDLTADSYDIIDLATNRSTDLKDLYTGRKIEASFRYGSTSETAASDTRFATSIVLNIYDMTYESGLANSYNIDPYGVVDGMATEIEPFAGMNDASQTTVKGHGSFSTASGQIFESEIVYDRKHSLTIFDTYGREAGTIGVQGGTARIYATIGNELGGYQTITIPVNYANRQIVSLFEANEVTSFATTPEGAPTTLHFEIDPFETYEKWSVYPQNGNKVEYADGAIGSFATSGSGVLVEWDDSKVIRTYSGSNTGYVTANVSYNGTFAQTLRYKVIVEDRTVTSFTNVLKEGVGPIQPYKYSYVDDVSASVVADYFNTDSEFVVEFGNMSRNAEEKSISFTLGALASANSESIKDKSKIVIGESEKNLKMGFILDGARGLSHKGKDARFYVTIPGFGLGAKGQQLARFDVPVAESYIHGLRFFNESMTGADLPGAEDNPAYYTLTYLEWLSQFDENATSDKNGPAPIIQDEYGYMDYYYDSYYVDNPYYFISGGGIPVPSQALVYVGPKMATSEEQYKPDINNNLVNATYSFLSDTAWDRVVNNRTRIKYNVLDHTTAFQLDLDGQVYNFMFNISGEWILDEQKQEDILFIEGYAYGKDEVILMPGNDIVRDTSILQISTSNDEIVYGTGIYRNEVYTITFSSKDVKRTFTFDGVAGGGSFRDNYMKWNFDMINWNAPATVMQYATMTLGGKGGQTVKWGFYVNNEKTLVNNTIPTMYSLSVGERDGEIVGESIELESTYKQLFSGSTLNQARKIPIEYSTGMSSFYSVGGLTNDTYPLGITREGGSYFVTATRHTPSYHYMYNDGGSEKVSDGSGYVGYITWDATKYRAYPSPNKAIGGKIVFSAYRYPEIKDATTVRDKGFGSGPYDNLQSFGAYLYHPDAMFGYSEIKPLIPNSWIYPKNMSTLGAITVTGDSSVTMPKSATNYKVVYNNNRFQQTAVPVISVETNSIFDLRYLPTIAVTEYRPTVEYNPGGLGGIFGTETVPGSSTT